MANVTNILLTFLLIIPLVMAPTGNDEEIGGTRVCKISEAPYMVSFLNAIGHAYDGCSGTLISYEWILTAAHCVDVKAVEDGHMMASAGCFFPLQPSSDSKTRRRRATKYLYIQNRMIDYCYSHSKFNRALDHEFRYDIAVLKADNPFEPHPLVQPARLPAKGYWKNCSVGFAIGWGRSLVTQGSTDDFRNEINRQKVNGKFPLDYTNPLKCTLLPIISFVKCIKHLSPEEYGISSSILCTFLPGGGKDACRGDSGGPLICNNDTIIGIIKGDVGCGIPGLPAGYTNVELYLDWIVKAQLMPQVVLQESTVKSIVASQRNKKDKKSGSDSSINLSVMLILANCIILFYKLAA